MEPIDEYSAKAAGFLADTHDAELRALCRKHLIDIDKAISEPDYLFKAGYQLVQEKLDETTYRLMLCKIIDSTQYKVKINLSTPTTPNLERE